MFENHFFWMALILFFLSVININVFLDYKKDGKNLTKVIGIVGVLGMLAGLLRLIILSLLFNWWWFIGVSGISLLAIGVFSYLFRSKVSFILATINLLAIPLVWWYGSQLNTEIAFSWFYNSLDAIKVFFS